MNIDRVDYVLITHIHLDHSGALGDFLEHYPMAKVICHERAIPHLVDPSALWAGSLKVLGDVAETYGEPKPVEEERLISHTQWDSIDLGVIETPGHAVHHLSFYYKGRLFAGEAGGTFCTVNDSEYLRPATPPRFLFEIFLESVDKLLQLDDQEIYFQHFGRAESSHRLLKMFREQLFIWKDVIGEQVSMDHSDIEQICLDALFEKDPYLKAFKSMDRGIQERERFFLTNSVRGFLGYLQEKD
jgi:glyoxylase-like metal-dependent hydrolase (beta-lactamase superfamily II)